jgi:hypothetical protein
MLWQKKGLIIKPGAFDWMITHAQNPFQEYRGDDIFRIFFAGRDKNNMARGGFAEININEPQNLIYITKKPIIDLGDLGCFDDCGVMPSTIVDFENKQFLYFTGWTQHKKTPFSFFIGLAISSDSGETFVRYSKAPVLGRNSFDPYLTASPFVLIENGVWKMWYVSCTKWEDITNIKETGNKRVLKHYYHIRYVESLDGIHWNPQGTVCIDFRNDEYAIARPIVSKEDGIYKMWYCYRGGLDTYRAGYAESPNGIEWTRKDDLVGIYVSKKGWDSQMICYPCVFTHCGKKYMLYNGNGYGKSGIGYAVFKNL